MAFIAVVANAQTVLVNYEAAAEVPEGITLGGTTEMASVKINNNKTAVNCIQLKNGYTTESLFNGNSITLSTEGGFKAGDVLSITGFFNNSDETKVSKVDIITVDADNKCTAVWTSEQFTNGRTVADDPTAQTYTLEQDMDNIIIGRNGGTGTNIWKLSVTRPAAGAGWDGTVTTSMDNGVITKIEDLDGLKLTFPGATTIGIVDEEECQYMALQNADGSELYGIWGPTMGSTYTIEGNTITLSGFMPYESATTDIPAGTTKLYIEDYGTLAIDGEGQYLETMEFTANIAAAAQPFMFTSVSNNNVEGNAIQAVQASEQGVMYQFNVTATGKALSKGTAIPTLSLAEDATVNFGAADLVAYEAETAYIRFMTLQQPFFTQPGTYVLSIPEGTFVDAEGTPNAAATLKWVITQGNEPSSFAITGATFGGQAAGSEVEALSYMAEITSANAITALHEGNITLTDADNQPVGGNAYVFGYEGESGSATVYARFTFDSEDHQLHTPGVYTLNIPAGMFVDAEGNLSEAYSASWTIKGSESQTINIESVEVGSVLDNSWGFNDVYYTATVKFQKPEGAVYAYSEGLHMELNGENTGVPFTFGQFGMITLEEGDEVTLVYKDNMQASTDDPDFEGEFRQAGSYVGTTEIYFMDENQVELPVVAKFTGSVVLPNLSTVEIGEPAWNIDADPYYGMISKNKLEANGIVMTFPEAKNITPDMQIKVVADLQTIVPSYGGGDGIEGDLGFGAPQFQTVIENQEFYGDAMFGDPVVTFPEFIQYISEAGAGGYCIDVKSIEVISSNGIEASWTKNQEEGQVVGVMFEVKESLEVEATAELFQTPADLYGDRKYQVVLTIENSDNELTAAGVAYAYTEGVVFYDESTFQEFTFNCESIEGVDVEEETDVQLTCTDSQVSQTTDTAFEGEIRAEGTYPAYAIIVLVDADFNEIGAARFSGDLTLSKDIKTGITTITNFNVTNVTYNLAGQRVNNAKGIVIKNGKKVVVK